MSEEKIEYITWKLSERIKVLEQNKIRFLNDLNMAARYNSQIRVLNDINRDIAFAVTHSDNDLKTLRESMERYFVKQRRSEETK